MILVFIEEKVEVINGFKQERGTIRAASLKKITQGVNENEE